MRPLAAAGWIPSLVLLSSFATRSAALDWTPILRFGDPVPELGDGAVVTALFSPSGPVDAQQVPVAVSTLPTLGTEAFYRWTPDDGLALVAAPEDGLVVSTSASPAANFAFVLVGDEEPDPCDGNETIHPDTLLRTAGDAPAELVAARGTQVPGAVDGVAYVELSNLDHCTGDFCFVALPLAIGDAGDLAFVARIATSPCATSTPALIGPDGAGGVELVALPGAPLPEPPAGGAPEHIGFGAHALSDDGELAFVVELPGDSSVIYRRAPGAAPVVVAEGTQSFGAPVMAPNGDLAWLTHDSVALLRGDPETSIDSLQLDTRTGEPIEIARTGEPVPGGPEGATFGALGIRFSTLALAPSGALGFTWTIAAEGDDVRVGIFERTTDGVVTRRVTSGDAAPGTGGAIFSELVLHALGDDGTWIFGADLTTAGGSQPAGNALYLQERGKSPRLLAREGDAMELVEGVLEPITEPTRIGTDLDAHPPAIVALMRGTTGAGALFLATVPEPRALAAAVLAIAVLAFLGRGPKRAQ